MVYILVISCGLYDKSIIHDPALLIDYMGCSGKLGREGILNPG
jgi:hypothetical protein